MTFAEALRVAELQASRALELAGITEGPIPIELVTELPRVDVRYRRLPTSGLSYWDGSTWVIGINRSEPSTRQRLTVFHELKHIIDHGRTANLYRGNRTRTAAQQAEHAADYFAGCVLMPKRLVKAAFGGGIQRLDELARLFDVSERAMEVRLAQIGISDDTVRCRPSGSTPSRARPTYYRVLSDHLLQGVPA